MPAQAQRWKPEIDRYIKARKKGWHFNFSREEWREILDAVHDGCMLPSHFDAMHLLRGANDYLNEVASYQSPSRKRAAWRRAAGSIRRARASLVAADPLGEATKLGGLLFSHSAKFSIVQILDGWHRFAEILSRDRDHGPNPRTDFFEGILDIWFEAGGRIARSRNSPAAPQPGRLCGPTVRYLQSVLRPVMKRDAPGPEGIRKIIEWYAASMEEMLATSEEFFADTLAIRSASDREANMAGEVRAIQSISKKQKKPDRAVVRRLVRGH
jgi:hypothetical protein